MNNQTKILVGAVAVIIVGIVISIGLAMSKPETIIVNTPALTEEVGGNGGQVNNTLQVFPAGVDLGSGYARFSKSGVIGANSNQGSWRNTTGRTVFVEPESTRMGYISGTASSTFAFFVATSTSSTLSSDFAHPGGEVFGIDGAVIATSTPAPRMTVGTTTNSGRMLEVRDGQYLVFQVQSRFGCITTGGVCERATSTNRGITNFLWSFEGLYQP